MKSIYRKLSLFLALTLLLTASLLSSCSSREEEGEGYSFTDDLGRQVTVRSHQRVAALLGSYAHLWHLAGGSVIATADDAWEDFDMELSEETVNLGGTKNLSLELLLGSAPDLVLASTNTPRHLEWESALTGAGITVAYFDVTSFEDYLNMLRICTDILENPSKYEEFGSSQQRRIRESLQRCATEDAPTVLVMRASAASIRAKGSESTVLGEMLLDFGCVNIADNDTGLLENLSIEAILRADPDFLLFIETGDDLQGIRENVQQMMKENPLWNELSAVKNGRVFFMEKALYNLKPNHRFADAYEHLEEILYEDPS